MSTSPETNSNSPSPPSLGNSFSAILRQVFSPEKKEQNSSSPDTAKSIQELVSSMITETTKNIRSMMNNFLAPFFPDMVKKVEETVTSHTPSSKDTTAPASLPATPNETLKGIETPNSKKLAENAKKVAGQMRSVGRCYTGVWRAIARTFGVSRIPLYGMSAYMAGPQLQRLARQGRVKEIKVANTELPNLPAGAIVVWARKVPAPNGRSSPHGHISIADGKGNEVSDHITKQMISHRGNTTDFQVFLPT